MRCYKVISGNYVTEVGTGHDGIEITKEEYDHLLFMILNPPEAPEGFEYRLLTNLTWEVHELPVVEPDPDEEISDEEALFIILGGETV